MVKSINGAGEFTCAWCHTDRVSLGHIGICRQYNGRVPKQKVDEILALKEIERQKLYAQESALLERTLLEVSRSLRSKAEMVDYTVRIKFSMPASVDITDVLADVVEAVGRKVDVEVVE